MVVYLTPAKDEVYEADMQRLAPHDVQPVLLRLGRGYTVQQVVHLLSSRSCKALLLPDDYHRHNELIEHAKACAHHMDLPVMPLSRYVLKNPPAPEKQNPVHANPDQTGAGRGLPAAASAG
jgi:hypothetical protein